MAASDPSWLKLTSRYGPYLKLVALSILLTIILIPLKFVEDLVAERKALHDKTVREVALNWGPSQSLVGVFVQFPYRYEVPRPPKVTRRGRRLPQPPDRKTGYVVVFPAELDVNAQVDPKVLRRSLYKSTVFTAALHARGLFAFDGLSGIALKPEAIDWSKGQLVVALAAVRGIKDDPRLRWSGADTKLLPDTNSEVFETGIHAVAPIPFQRPARGKKAAWPSNARFELTISLAGSGTLGVAPAAKTNRFKIRSSWPHPGFSGLHLPNNRKVGNEGFEAEYRISYLSRPLPQVWRSHDPSGRPNQPLRLRANLLESQSKVSLVTPIDLYRKNTRAVKYGMLFVVLILATILAFETAAGLQFHTVQYALVGAALSLFYLLLLSLSEIIVFGWAYAVAATMSAGLVSGYVAVTTRSMSTSATIAALLALVYGFLYVVLQLEDYALVAGSIGLFIALAAIMWTTRKVDWGALHSRPAPQEQ